MYIIAGLYRHQRLIAPKGSHTRPTAGRLREAVFNICQHSIEGARFLDLFAGSGAMGFEAISRGAQSAVFVDSHRESIRCIRDNASKLKVEGQCQILQGDALACMERLGKQDQTFDIIFADPPYGTSSAGSPLPEGYYSKKIIQWIDAHSILSVGGILFVEEGFQYQPQLDHLEKLKLIDIRRMGPAALHQYKNSR